MTIILFIAGLAFLIIGAEVLVQGASRIAAHFGISPLIIGLTVVAFGTSSPELAVSIKSVLSDQTNIALGNVVGSNIFNILFILGLSALIVPLQVSQQLIRLDVPLMIGLSVLVLLLAMDQIISQLDGWLLLAGLAGYLGFLIYQSRKNIRVNNIPNQNSAVVKKKAGKTNWLLNVVFVVGGLILLVIGSRWLVNASVKFAEFLGISELVIGLTIVAVGTSLPEVVTSLIAAIRGERDIAVGNVVGSNILNIMGVLGVASIFAPTGIGVSEAVYHFDIPIMIAVAFACLPIFFTGGVINRWEGGLLVSYYAIYTLYLILAATEHDNLPIFSKAMLFYVIPITVITIIIVVIQELRTGKRKHLE